MTHALIRLTGLVAALLLCAPSGATADDARPPQPAIVIANPGHCIAPVEQMRRNHPDMLRHQRDRTVHEGIRGARASLNACIRCHASRVNGSVLGTGENFCQGCHQYVAVRLDCFECHQAAPAALPTAAVASGARP